MALFNAGAEAPVLKQNIFGGWGKCVVVAEVEREPRNNNAFDETVDEDEIELCSQPEPEDFIPETSFHTPSTPSPVPEGVARGTSESPQPPPLSQETEEDCHPTPPPAARRPSLLGKPVPKAKVGGRGSFRAPGFTPLAKGKGSKANTGAKAPAPASPGMPKLTPVA